MNKTHAKLLIWVALSGLVMLGAWLALRSAADLLKYFQEGADPAAALKIVPNIPLDSQVKLSWLPQEGDTGRDMEPTTREQIEGAYIRAWLQWNISYAKGEPYGLKTYFAGPAFDAITASIEGLDFKNYKITQSDTSHTLQLHLYSADGTVVALTDKAAAVTQVVHNAAGKELLVNESSSTYEIVMYLDDGNWRIHQWVRTGENSPPALKATPKTGLVSVTDRDFILDNQKFRLAGVNYYPKATPWDKFWTGYSPAVIDKDFTLLQNLGKDNSIDTANLAGKLNPGINTLRIFIPFEQFGGPKPLPKMLANLDDLLDKAYKHGLRVIVTLFDFRTDYSLLLWPAADRHLEALLTRFKDNPAILAWDIKNEPDLDYKTGGRQTVNAWLVHTIRQARTYDPNHLVTIGWSSPAAVDLSDQVDFVSFHYYAPVNQLETQLKKVQAGAGSQPVAVTEFGLSTWNSFLFPGGHSEPEQTQYFAQVLKVLRTNGTSGSLAWTMFDFNYVPAKVAGSWPWQTGPQKQMGIFDSNEKAKPAATLLLPDSNLDVTQVPFWAILFKPFWLNSIIFGLVFVNIGYKLGLPDKALRSVGVVFRAVLAISLITKLQNRASKLIEPTKNLLSHFWSQKR